MTTIYHTVQATRIHQVLETVVFDMGINHSGIQKDFFGFMNNFFLKV
jgi:hypothetical protein